MCYRGEITKERFELGDDSLRPGDDSETGDPEVVVDRILKHTQTAEGIRYHVLWVDGDDTRELLSQFIDIEDGEEVINEKLLHYRQLKGL